MTFDGSLFIELELKEQKKYMNKVYHSFPLKNGDL